MKSINKAIILGNLGASPELRKTSRGQSVTNFTVATSNGYRDQQTGEWCENTDWHRVVVWGSKAEACVRYLEKGSRVYIEGRLETQSRLVNGEKKYTTQIVAHEVVFLSYKDKDAEACGRIDEILDRLDD
jgi:single-strand DNA-binding protein